MWLSHVLSRSLSSLLSAPPPLSLLKQTVLQRGLACVWYKPGKRVLESHTETSPICLQNKEKSNSAQPCEEPDIWLVWSSLHLPAPCLQLLYPSPSGCSVFELPLTKNLARPCETDQVPCHGSLYFRQEYFFGISNNTGHFLEVHSKGCLNTSALCGHGNCILSSPHKNTITNRPYYFPD